MESPKPSDTEKAAQAFAVIGETTEKLPQLAKNPSVKALGPIDFDALEDRDKPFFKNLLTLGSLDPDIIRRVLIMRHKLNNEIMLTQAEAEELITVLQCKGFYRTGLDLSGMEFGILDLCDAVVGGDFNVWDTVVRGDNCQTRMEVGGDNNQGGMKVEGDNQQQGMEVKGDNNQWKMQIRGYNIQAEMQVQGDSNQYKMKVEGFSNQYKMKVGGNNNQHEMKVGGANDQKAMGVEGRNNRSAMQVRGDYIE
ncbi:hypothetical protein KJ951_02415 [Patescibacteria group bacterium]|nr:hypothetical protein [Patescibacteria group bacterium]MBU1703235.1 hypothetical protein [Patescibacteria group bacterium]MBU1953837.1 hypothetical protein [Patescibacteria group bacterium]